MTAPTPADLLDRIGAQTIIADLALAEAHRLLLEIEVERHRTLVCDHLDCRLIDLQARLDRLKELVGESVPPTEDEIEAGQRRVLEGARR